MKESHHARRTLRDRFDPSGWSEAIKVELSDVRVP